MGAPRRAPPRLRALRGAFLALLAACGVLGLLWAAGVPLPLLPGDGRPTASAETAPDALDDEEDLAEDAPFRPGLRPSPLPPRAEGADDGTDAAAAAKDAEAAAALAAVEGAVLRGDGAPARRATVLAVDGLGFSASAETDASGTFRLDLPPGRYDLVLRGGRDGALLVRSHLVEAGGSAGLTFTLGGAASVRVEVTRDARPVEGAEVRASLRFDGAQERLAAGITDRDGAFLAEGLPSGPYLVEVEHPAGVVYARSLDLSSETKLAFPLPAPVRVAGLVTDADSRAPLAARVDVSVALPDGISVRSSGAAGTDGLFALDVPRGRVTSVLVLGPDAYAPWPAPGPETNAAMQTLRGVPQGQPVHLAVAMRPGAVVAGTVTLEGTKEPVGDLALRLQPDVGPARTATTAKDGAYRVVGVARGNHRLLVETPGWYPTTADRVGVPPGAAGGAPVAFDLRVTSSGVVSGKVVLSDGTAVAGARVWLVGAGGAVRGARRAGRELEAWSASDGSFTIDDVPPTVWCRVRAAKGEAEALPGDAFRAADRPPPPQRLVLMPTGVVRGRVTDLQTREGVAGATVHVNPLGEPWGRTSRTLASGAEGRYEVAGLIPGRWRLLAQKGGYLGPGVPVEVTLTGDAREAEQGLVLDPGLAIAGWVHDLAGAPLADVRLSLEGVEDASAPIRPRRGRSDARGAFRWTALRSGTYVLTATRGGLRAVRIERLRGGEERLRIVMEPAAPPGGR